MQLPAFGTMGPPGPKRRLAADQLNGSTITLTARSSETRDRLDLSRRERQAPAAEIRSRGRVLRPPSMEPRLLGCVVQGLPIRGALENNMQDFDVRFLRHHQHQI